MPSTLICSTTVTATGTGGLGPKSVRNLHGVLHKGLADVVRWGRTQRNIADLADPPRWNRADVMVWTAEQLRTFLRTVAGDRIYAAWLLLATTGMRRGEVLGLRWSNLDLDQGHRRRRSVPGCRRLRRCVAVRAEHGQGSPGDRLDPATTAALRSHRLPRRRSGSRWERAGVTRGWSSCSPTDRPSTLSGSRPRSARRAPRPGYRASARMMICAPATPRWRSGAGVYPEIVSERLGHAAAISLDVYSHVSPTMQREAAGLVASWLLDEPPVAKWLQSSDKGRTSPSEG